MRKKREKYQWLTLAERGKIEILIEQGKNTYQIAKILGRHFNTIKAEIERGTVTVLKDGYKEVTEYSPEAGQNRTEWTRRDAAKKAGKKGPNKCPEFLAFIEEMVGKKHYSIEAAVDYAKENHLFTSDEMVCVTTLYSYVNSGVINVKNIDLPNKVRRKAPSTQPVKKNDVLPDGVLRNDQRA